MTVAILAIFSFGATLGLLFLFTPIAERNGLVDLPSDRKVHKSPVPLVGGICLYVAFGLAAIIFDVPTKVVWFLVASSILVVAGALDDAIGLGVGTRFLIQALAALMMIILGDLKIHTIGLGGLGWSELAQWSSLLFTLVAVVGLSNAFNLVDGIDGLAAGHALVGLLSLSATLYFIHGFIHNLEWLTILISSTFAFFIVNLSMTPLRKVFLGDAGSLLLGFTMAWVLIYYTQDPVSLVHPVAALWCVAIPVYDTLIVILRRLRNGSSPFSSDRGHMHHLLISLGLSERTTLIVVLWATIVLSISGMSVLHMFGPITSLSLFILIFGLLSFFLLRVRINDW